MDGRRGENAVESPTGVNEDSEQPLVSVVIPTYDRPSYLPGAIETALGQTYDPVEVVVVDDGSETDAAADIVDKYADRSTRVSLQRHEENRGLSAARNTGIEASSGDFVAFLDDDDRWHERKLHHQLAAFDRCDDDVGVVSSLLSSVSPTGDLLRAERSKPTGDLREALCRRNVVGSPSRIVVRRACLEDVGGFDESLAAKQDWDLYLRIAENWRFETLQEVLCYRTIHDDALSRDPATAARDLTAVREKHESTIRDRGCWNASMASHHWTVGLAALFEGSRRTGRRHVRQSFEREPTAGRLLVYASTFVPGAFGVVVALKRWGERALLADDRARPSSANVPGTNDVGQGQRPIPQRDRGERA
ncbi:glycosyltransferase family 2 protein [Halapricum salinum]|uniref:Glycosyltransferase family 2 protein n=1 Tax=Halapricum salinum TaxID=1457250 RepID=A0A4D6H8T6_9EURY|nr:glycosyltransferase family A protein [Halapricum salinum]QCC50045.1 glycosyltransferase family 2 protein [Halapricum salinum]